MAMPDVFPVAWTGLRTGLRGMAAFPKGTQEYAQAEGMSLAYADVLCAVTGRTTRDILDVAVRLLSVDDMTTILEGLKA